MRVYPFTRSEDATLQSPPFLPNEIPPCLREFLGIVKSPQSRYHDVYDSRDRRQRLLLRRFVNQIQHGCKNPLCDIPTCLSYRKRNTAGPFRSLKDAAAHALAWQCIEHYSNAGQDLNNVREPHGVRSKGGRSASRKIYRGDGLCWNEPVVPWYQCPDETDRPRRSPRKDPRADPLFGDGSKPFPLSASRQQRSSNPDITPVTNLPNGHITNGHRPRSIVASAPAVDKTVLSRPKFDEASLTQTLFTRPEIVDNFLGRSLRLDPAVSTTQANSPPSAPVGYAPFGKKTPQEDVMAGEDTRVKKGPAALSRPMITQSSSDASTSISDKPEGTEANPNGKDVSEDTIKYTNDLSLEPEIILLDLSHSDHAHQDRDTSPITTSFHLLPTSAILWLTDTFSARYIDKNRSEQEIRQFASFVQQSIFLCFSHPLRLISSASTWDNYFDAVKDGPEDIDDLTYEQTCKLKMEQYEKAYAYDDTILKDKSQLSLPQRSSVFAVVTELLRVIPTGGGLEAMIDFLFSALQHAYILPDWAQTKQKYVPRRTETQSFDSTSYLPNELIAHLFLLITNMLIGFAKYVGETPNSYRLRDTADMRKMTLQAYVFARGTGTVYNERTFTRVFKDVHGEKWRDFLQGYLANIYWQHDDHVLRIITAMADIVSHRIALSAAAHSMNSPEKMTGILESIVFRLEHPPHPTHAKRNREQSYSTAVRVFEIMQTVFMAKWNRKAVISRRGPVAGALMLIARIFEKREELGLSTLDFEMPFVSGQFDAVEMPNEWMSFPEGPTQIHILHFPFLFSPTTLAKYFRAINLRLMQREHEKAVQLFHNANVQIIASRWQVFGIKEVLERTRAHMAKFFVMTIRRDRVLEDAIEQIWRREKQELLRPLKVRLGKDEGEDGLDHGGVQQEFFRLAFAQAFDPAYGMFTVDESTRMAWFSPGSLEPLYKFETLGILMALALYNAVTIPVTLPRAFYRSLLGQKVRGIADIEDGWPELSKSFRMMLDWEDGDVGDVMARTYEFSYEGFGEVVNVDISKDNFAYPWTKPAHGESKVPFDRAPTYPTASQRARSLSRSSSSSLSSVGLSLSARCAAMRTSKSKLPESASPPHSRSRSSSESPSSSGSQPSSNAPSEPPLVTNENRRHYVTSYIKHLTHHSVAPQLTAFMRGFRHSTALMSARALLLFTPDTLRAILEGEHTPINVDDLEATATYDEYNERDDYIKWFWDIVRGWKREGDAGEEKVRKLLEFVTSSSRVPIGGLGGVTFMIQRNGTGGGDDPDSDSDESIEQLDVVEVDGILAGGQAAQISAEIAAQTAEAVETVTDAAQAEQGPPVYKARLPSSSTCYGRLLLPQYKTKEILKERLEKAIENSIGFGSL